MTIVNSIRRYQLFTFFVISFFACQHLLLAQETPTPTPTLTEIHKFLANDGQSGDGFGGRVLSAFDGGSVSLSDDRALIGASGDDVNGRDSGSAYIFERDSNGWKPVVKLTPDDEDDQITPDDEGDRAGDRFGGSVSLSGARALIGAPNTTNTGTSGSAYIFETDSNGDWRQIAKLTADDADSSDINSFGFSICLDGDRALIGARTGNGKFSGQGAAYIFERDSSGKWNQIKKLTADDGVNNDNFGASVALSEGLALIGAPTDDDEAAESGSVYIFGPDSDGPWSQIKKLTADDPDENVFFNTFGSSVSISGDRVLIGAEEDSHIDGNKGSAYIFELSDELGKWMQVAKLVPSDKQRFTRFGGSVSLAGDRAIIGSRSGAVYVFEPDEQGAWRDIKKLIKSKANSNNFGDSISLAGDQVLIGAGGDDENGNNSGAAYLFDLTADQIPPVITVDPEAVMLSIDSEEPDLREGVTAFDDIDGVLTDKIEATGEVDVSVPGDYEITYNVTDSAGNEADPKSRIYTVVDDAPPVITVDPEEVTLSIDGEEPNLLEGVTAFDNVDGDLTDEIEPPVGNVDTSTPGKYTIEYNVTDSAGNKADPKTRVYTVVEEGEQVRLLNESVLDIGNHWEYRVQLTLLENESVDETLDLVEDITESKMVAGINTRVRREKLTGAGVDSTEFGYFFIDTNNHFTTAGRDETSYVETVRNDDPTELFPLIINTSDTNRKVGSGLYHGADKSTSDTWDGFEDTFLTYVGQETITVPAGTFDCIVVDSRIEWDDQNGETGIDESRFWMHPDIGVIKSISNNSETIGEFTSTTSFTSELTDFQICGRAGAPPVEDAKLLAKDGHVGDRLGFSVSVSGGRALIGGEQFDNDNDDSDSGSAHIFEPDSSGNWIDVAKLTAEDAEEGDLFGRAVSLSGDRALIGAQWDDDKGNASGSAYIFEPGSNGNWTQQAKLTAKDGQAGDLFGLSVSLDGDRALIGAFHDDDKGTGSGAAYIFERNSDGEWMEITKITADDGKAGDLFGWSVSLAGDRALISAREDDEKGADSGSVYVFDRDSSGTWKETTKLIADDGQENDRFGWSVSLAGDQAVIGRNRFNEEDNSDPGAAYIFEMDENGDWHEVKKLTTDDAEKGFKFGLSVSLVEDKALIGEANRNTAYLFERDSSGNWTEAAELTSSSFMSYPVSLSQDLALVGAPLDDENGGASGAAFIFNLGSCGENHPPACEISDFTVESGQQLQGQVMATDADGGILFFSLGTHPVNGTMTFEDDGRFIYQPKGDFVGEDSFSYTVTDNEGASPQNACIANISVIATDITATRAFLNLEYSSPGVLDVSITLNRVGTETVTSLSISESIPLGWLFDSIVSDNIPEIKPQSDTVGTLEFGWISIPEFPVTLTYRLNIPEGESGSKFFTGNVSYRTTENEIEVDIVGSQEISLAAFHDADQNQDWEIQLSPELTRLIQFFNSGGYHCEQGTEDDFAPGNGIEDCNPHDADQNQDWEIQLSPELTRLIQFFNSGGYHRQSGTEDGFAPGKPLEIVGLTNRVASVVKNATGESELVSSRSHDATYSSPGSIDVSIEMDYTGSESITALTIKEIIPANWTFDTIVSDGAPEIAPQSNASGVLEFSWITIPDLPVTLTYRLTIPADESGTRSLTGDVKYRTSGSEISRITPDTTVSDGDTTVLSVIDAAPGNATGLNTASVMVSDDVSLEEGATETFQVTVNDGTPPYSYTWELDGVAVGEDSPSFTYTPTFDTVLHPDTTSLPSLVCVITDSANMSATVTWSSLQIHDVNQLPSITESSIMVVDGGAAFLGNTLKAEASGWEDEDGDAQDFLYQWQINGMDIDGAKDNMLLLDASTFTVGYSITVEITPFDGIDEGTSVTSTPVLIVQSIGDWQLVIDVSENSNAVRNQVTFGMENGAGDGFDFGIDEDVAPQEPNSTLTEVYFDQNFTFLATDIRGKDSVAQWLLYVDPRGNTVELSWDSQQIPEGKILSLYEVDIDDKPLPVSSILMNKTTTMTVDGALERWYRLRFADDFRATVTCTPGWNLISLPLTPTASAVADVFSNEGDQPEEEQSFRDGRRGLLVSGFVWAWERNSYVQVSTIEATRGYWCYLDEEMTILVDGKPVAPNDNGDVIIPLSQGWNLYGPIAPIDITYPLQTPLQGTIWWWDGTKYNVANELQPYGGYWINSFEKDYPFNLAK